ncbi:hypothetical protein P1X14_18410 [Sphingomonas sp. AOB5]|uniref:hypothetical protein n=1 Tax=Sphingomonas sp. AOB5 TaxID=3034017 RepID=UPI0023F7D154|nr:hypothetical protein [Sphingomonas sp. AOB5]MDF7777239.1 hypothetical protein [Sphingomonas sp. AOB5]
MRALILLPLLALAACQSDSDPGPGEVTRGEARQLDEAAAATDINAVEPANDQEAQ